MKETPLATATMALVALIVVGAIVVFGAFIDVKVAVLVLAGIALAGAIARMVAPATRVFSVRRRAVDVAMMLGFAVALAVLGLTTILG